VLHEFAVVLGQESLVENRVQATLKGSAIHAMAPDDCNASRDRRSEISSWRARWTQVLTVPTGHFIVSAISK
jgi:hypothetical protein